VKVPVPVHQKAARAAMQKVRQTTTLRRKKRAAKLGEEQKKCVLKFSVDVMSQQI